MGCNCYYIRVLPRIWELSADSMSFNIFDMFDIFDIVDSMSLPNSRLHAAAYGIMHRHRASSHGTCAFVLQLSQVMTMKILDGLYRDDNMP